MTKEQDIQKLGRAISEELVTLGDEVKASGGELEASLAQLDQYQSTIASLRQSILACEGELRTVSSPAYTARDRDKALAEQSVRTINHILISGKYHLNYKRTSQGIIEISLNGKLDKNNASAVQMLLNF